MLRDVYWRQYPIDLLSDDKMACVEAMLPDELKHIPYMIYIAALRLCDENGVFDLDDGVVLARLVRCKDVNTVLDIVNKMRQRKILYRLFDGSRLCGLVDWTYTDKKPRTIEERRRLVAERIEKEQGRAGVDKDFTLPGEQRAPAAAAPQKAPENLQPGPIMYVPKGYTTNLPATPEAETAPEAGDFSCLENDKKAENVVMDRMDDKNAKNVVTLQYSTVQDNKTVHTNIQDIHTNTHTQQQLPSSGPIEGPTQGNCQDTNAVGEENIQTENTDNANIPTDEQANCGFDTTLLADEALRESTRDVEVKDTGGLVAYLNDFFVKNCYGYKQNQSAGAINTLAGLILELSDEVNPPETVAGLVCSEFKKMCDGQRDKYWARMPLLPANMIKPRAWSELVQYAGKILATNTNNEKFTAAAEKAQKEYEAERNLVGDAVREEYLKYNIDPEAPDAQQKLLIAKSKEAAVARAADDEEFEIF